MKSFLANLRYVAVPVLSNMIQSIPNREEQILWVGCCDSHIDETDVLDVPRQELFVHRNLGNKLSNGDASSLGAIEFCVQDIEVCFHVSPCLYHLTKSFPQVRHVIICGHYGCGLINSSGQKNVANGWLA
jgi:carbonic anhydrase